MKTVVMYDSKFGNTERLARAIATQLGAGEPASVVAAGAASEHDLAEIDLLAVGGPTQGHGVSPALRAFLDRLPPEAVRDVPAVTFDTRLTWPPSSFWPSSGPSVHGGWRCPSRRSGGDHEDIRATDLGAPLAVPGL